MGGGVCAVKGKNGILPAGDGLSPSSGVPATALGPGNTCHLSYVVDKGILVIKKEG